MKHLLIEFYIDEHQEIVLACISFIKYFYIHIIYTYTFVVHDAINGAKCARTNVFKILNELHLAITISVPIN